MTAARKARGMRTQLVVAQWYAGHGFPYAESAGAGRQGRDILGLPGLAPEVKARTGFEPLAWIKQAEDNAGGDLPYVVLRCNGQGETTVGDWPVLMKLSHHTGLLRAAGYGDEEEAA